MKKFAVLMMIAFVCVIFIIIFSIADNPKGQVDATLGVERVYSGWSEDQEAVFDSIRSDTSDLVYLFDRLNITKEVLDKRVKKWINVHLANLNEKPLPKNCFVVYELLEFSSGGVMVIDKQGKKHGAMTYGTEPVAYIFLDDQDPISDKPFLSYFLRCLNGYGELKDPKRTAKVVVDAQRLTEFRTNSLGVINEYYYPCHFIPNIKIWLDFAENHNISAMYLDSTWHGCTAKIAREKCLEGFKIAIDIPAETEVMSFIDTDGSEFISIRYPDSLPEEELLVTWR